jgi:hypothetical protein
MIVGEILQAIWQMHHGDIMEAVPIHIVIQLILAICADMIYPDKIYSPNLLEKASSDSWVPGIWKYRFIL